MTVAIYCTPGNVCHIFIFALRGMILLTEQCSKSFVSYMFPYKADNRSDSMFTVNSAMGEDYFLK